MEKPQLVCIIDNLHAFLKPGFVSGLTVHSTSFSKNMDNVVSTFDVRSATTSP